jgi:glutathionylspermidine synthase
MNDRVKFLLSGVWKYMQPIVIIFLTKVGRMVIEAAAEYVRWAEENVEGGNEEKHSAVFNRIKEDLKSELKKFKDSWIDIAIKIAVEWMKSK